MIDLAFWLLAGVPWFSGFCFGFINCPAADSGWALRMFFGCAVSLLFMVGLGASAFAFTYLGMGILHLALPWSLLVLAISAHQVHTQFNSVALKRPPKQEACRQLQPFICACAVAVGVLLLLSLYHASHLPAVGWDVLWYKADITKEYLANSLSENVQPWPYNYKTFHPSVVEAMSAWGAWLRVLTGATGPIYPFWSFAFMSTIGAAISFSAWKTNSLAVGAVSGIFVTTIPLVQNHAMIAGYSELFIFAFMTCSICAFITGLEVKSRGFIAISVVLAVFMSLLKNIGPLISGFVIFVYSIYLLIDRRPERIGITPIFIKKFFSYGVVILAVVWALANELSVDLGDFRYSHLSIVINELSFLKILTNVHHAFLMNSSFSLGFVLFLGAIFVRTTSRLSDVGLDVVLWIGGFILVVLTGMQLTEYGFQIAQASSDTGLSRLALIFASTWSLLVCFLIKEANIPAPNG